MAADFLMTDDREWELFEAWASEREMRLQTMPENLHLPDRYHSSNTEMAWIAWQARADIARMAAGAVMAVLSHNEKSLALARFDEIWDAHSKSCFVYGEVLLKAIRREIDAALVATPQGESK